jgi:hypothetical protein
MSANIQIPTIQQNAYGFRLQLRTGIPLLDTTELELKISPPAPADIITRSLYDDNIVDRQKGIVGYDVQQGDFAVTGTYKIQLIDVTPGRHLPSRIVRFRVVSNLQKGGT